MATGSHQREFLLFKSSLGTSGESELGAQVVGRVHRGLETLEKVNEAATDPDDIPLQRISITSCGLTDAQVRGQSRIASGRITPCTQKYMYFHVPFANADWLSCALSS